MKKTNIVLGAGAAGLAAAWQLTDKGKAVHVLERKELVGGLISYYEKAGNIYEYGSHVFHTDNEELRTRVKNLMGSNILEFDRAGRLQIKFLDKYYRYPLNGIDILINLPFKVSLKCVISMFVSMVKWKLFKKEPANSADVLKKHFGNTLYDIFFKEYTHKFWGMPCEELDKAFALERIPRSDVLKIVHDLFEKLGIGKMFSGHHLTERAIGKLYYCKNGINELTNTIAQHVIKHNGSIETNVEIKKIYIENNKAVKVEYISNDEIKYKEVENIISTIPINYLIELITPAPDIDVLTSARRLKYLPLTVCGLLVSRKPVRDAILTYFRNSIYNRLSEPTTHGLETIPVNNSIILAEMTDYSIQLAGLKTDDDITQKVIEDLVNEGLITKEEILDTCVYRYKEAYPIYHVGFREDLKIIEKYINSLENVISTGRQGAFCYVNIHATMQMAITAVNEMLTGK